MCLPMPPSWLEVPKKSFDAALKKELIGHDGNCFSFAVSLGTPHICSPFLDLSCMPVSINFKLPLSRSFPPKKLLSPDCL